MDKCPTFFLSRRFGGDKSQGLMQDGWLACALKKSRRKSVRRFGGAERTNNIPRFLSTVNVLLRRLRLLRMDCGGVFVFFCRPSAACRYHCSMPHFYLCFVFHFCLHRRACTECLPQLWATRCGWRAGSFSVSRKLVCFGEAPWHWKLRRHLILVVECGVKVLWTGLLFVCCGYVVLVKSPGSATKSFTC